MPISPPEADRRRAQRAAAKVDTRLEAMIDDMLSDPPAADGRWYLDQSLVRGDQGDAVRRLYEEAGWRVTFEDHAVVFCAGRG